MSRLLPHIGARRIAIDNIKGTGGFNIKVDFFIDIENHDPLSFLSDKTFVSNFRILVAQVTDPEIVARIQNLGNKPFSNKDFNKIKRNAENYRIYSLHNAKFLKSMVTRSYEIPFSTDNPFKILESISDLTYLFLPFYETTCPRRIFFGRPTVEKVFEAGNITNTATAFFLPTGKQYTGPVNLHGKTYRAGDMYVSSKTSSASYPKLTTKSVMNTTVHDNRVLNFLKTLNYSHSHMVPKKVPYYSDILFANGPDGACRFSFSIDFARMVRDSSQHAWLFRNPAISSMLLENAKILSLKVFRKRIDQRVGINTFLMRKNRDFSHNDTVKLITHSSDASPGKLQANILIAPKTTSSPEARLPSEPLDRIVSLPQENLGVIEEIKLITDSRSIRSFTGTDLTTEVVTAGSYQYGVEIEVSDPTKDFMELQQLSMRASIDTLTKYSNSAARPHGAAPSFSIAAQQFSQNFTSTNPAAPILRAIETYVNTINILNTRPIANTSSLVLQLYCLVCPMNGLPKNISEMLKLFHMTSRRIEKHLEIGYCTKPTKSFKPGSISPIKIKKDTKSKSRPYVKWSDDYFFSLGLKNVGYYFLNPNLNKPGLARMPWAAYEELVHRQLLKLFPTISPFHLTSGIEVDVNNTKYSFLTPLSVGLGGKETFNFFNIDHEFYSIDKYNSILAEILRLNKGMSIIGDQSLYSGNSNFTKFGQKLRDGLIDLFAFQSCTIDNFPAFSSKTTTNNCEDIPPDSRTSVVDKSENSKVATIAQNVKNTSIATRTYEETEINPSNIFMRLANYDIFYENADITPSAYNASNLKANLTSGDINSLPPSMKALMSLYTGTSNKPLNINIGSLSGNHRDHLGFLYFNFYTVYLFIYVRIFSKPT